MEEQEQMSNEPHTEQKKAPTPWYGIPRCDELPEPGMIDKGLAKAGKWATDKVSKLALGPTLGKGAAWLANKIAPWNYKDGPFGRCPVDDKDKDK